MPRFPSDNAPGAAELAAPGGPLRILPGGAEADTAVVEMVAWPGLEKWRAPAPTGPGERLAGARSLTLLAVAESGSAPERFGLGAYELAVGRTLLDAGLIVGDDLSCRDPHGLLALAQWSAAHPPGRPAGPRRVLTVTGFNHEILVRHGYRGRVFVVSPELGHTIALLAAWWTPARDWGRWGQAEDGARVWQEAIWSGGWSFGLAGLGHFGEREIRRKRGVQFDRTWIPASPNYPRVYAKAVGRVGTMVGFGSCGFRRNSVGEIVDFFGEWTRDPNSGRMVPYRGRFHDLVGTAATLDGSPSLALVDHLAAFGMQPVEIPAAVVPGAEAAEQVTDLVSLSRDFAFRLDQELRR